MDALSRTTDPNTSHSAAAGVGKKRLNQLHKIVLKAAILSKYEGVTKAEVALLNPTIKVDSLSPRFKQLRKAGLLCKRLHPDGSVYTRASTGSRAGEVHVFSQFATATEKWHRHKEFYP